MSRRILEGGGWSSWYRSVVMTLACMTLIWCGAPLNAQGGAAGEPGTDLTLLGQWSGPFLLESVLNQGSPDEWAEIVHMVTLPKPNSGWVMFWNRRNRDLNQGTSTISLPYSTWMWNPNSPNSVTSFTIPGTSSGALDPFCGAQVFTAGPDGKLLAIGGTDMTEWEFDGDVVGTKGVFEFDSVALDPSVPSSPSWTTKSSLSEERYYGGTLRKRDGVVVKFGNAGPDGTPGVEDAREEFSGTGWTSRQNVRWNSSCGSTSTSYGLASPNYPDVHVLSTGNWLRVDGDGTFMMDEVTCSVSHPTEPERFRDWDASSSSTGETPKKFGNSVHILYVDGAVRREVVYAIGGNDGQGCGGTFSNAVLKMTDPTVGVSRWDESPPDLFVERHTSNSIILLDGSIVVIGGARDEDPSPGVSDCGPVYEVERYEPPELFSPPGSASWRLVASITHPRTYHSTAVLLPDGSVVSAGGVGNNDGQEPAWHSIEHYRPGYFFNGSRRPVIDQIGPTTVPGKLTYGETNIPIAVKGMNESSGEFRVALLSPCAGTHNVDFSQRYVELFWNSFTPNGGDAIFLVSAPENGDVAPPGMYMLTVVNNAGLPSVAEWVEIGPP